MKQFDNKNIYILIGTDAVRIYDNIQYMACIIY